ncbi:sialic acid-binding Ig-like lectin 15 [Amblyraja radiata]|uniref:sialic acid-binding Ig-like lectin 15 n=1 Tax=Amblyraja radiata TaxID=386614 RepID=UPI00140403E0|nr:sialic acid-binding Ig-like lectin 15 [Amblyraja radiata]
MWSLRVCLCTVLLSVSVQGYNFSYKSWTISGADVVSAVEGTSAVLPCTFTHPPTDHNLIGSVLWYRRKSGGDHLVFNCTYLNPDRCTGEEVTPATGSGLLRFVGNLRQRDASIMVERLSREDDGAWYRCRVELNVGNLHAVDPTRLTVRAAVVNVSVVTGTEGASATLACVFPPPALNHILHKVTWMRKDPYRHIVAFRPQADGSWAAENGATRFELVGDPELGSVSTRIKQLSGEDSHDYLCLVEFRKPDYSRPASIAPS